MADEKEGGGGKEGQSGGADTTEGEARDAADEKKQ